MVTQSNLWPGAYSCWNYIIRLRISIRTALILFLAIAIGLGWLVNRADRQRRAVRDIESVGGQVWYQNESRVDLGDWWNSGQSPVGTSTRNGVRSTSILNDMRWSVTAIEFEFHVYDDSLHQAISQLRRLKQIYVKGHEPKYAIPAVQDDFPNLNVESPTSNWFKNYR